MASWYLSLCGWKSICLTCVKGLPARQKAPADSAIARVSISITAVEQFHRVKHAKLVTLFSGFPGNLQDTSGVRSDDSPRFRADDVAHLPLAQPQGHFGLSQVVTPRAAAADVRLWQLNESFTSYGAD